MPVLLVKRITLFSFGFLFAAFVCSPLRFSFAQDFSLDKEALQTRVRQLDFQDADVQRAHLDWIFQLAALYEKEGNVSEAIELYDKGLRIDGWRWEHQLILAKLLCRSGATKAALEKAKLVYHYAEDSSLVDEAEEVLSALGFYPDGLKTSFPKNPSGQVEIVLVPMGPVDLRLLEEVRQEAQAKTGIVYSVATNGLNPGEPDLTGSNLFLKKLSDSIEGTLPLQRLIEMLTEEHLTREDLRTSEGMGKFLERISRETSVFPRGVVSEYQRQLLEAQKEERFDARRLRAGLEKAYPMGKYPNAQGYIGIISKVITASDGGDSSRAWFAPGQGYGVMTYRLFTASFRKEKPNRPRLRSRFIKELAYNTFQILGFQECSNPICVVAASENTANIDEKGEDLCPVCRGFLEDYLKKIKPGVYPPFRVVREANQLIDEGRYNEAMETFERAHQLNPKNLEVRLLLARLYDDTDHLEEALALYRDLLKKNPQEPQVLSAFLWFCANHTWWPYGQDEGLAIKEGMAEGEKALSRWNTDPVFLETYGWLAYKAEQPEWAERLLRQSLTYEATARRFYILSAVCSQLRKRGEALRAFQQAELISKKDHNYDPSHNFHQLAETMLQGYPDSSQGESEEVIQEGRPAER